MTQVLVRQSLRNHRKVLQLAKETGTSPETAMGMVISLWLWALDNAPDGDLGIDFADFVGPVTGHMGDPYELINSLVKSGWLTDTEDFGAEPEDSTYMLLGWDDDDGPISRYTEADPNK